jgi:HD-like signal output (HDOD) protein
MTDALPRVLFVDDEPRVLQGLKLSLWRYEHEWRTEYSSSGAEALALLELEPFDAVVSDMRMPGMDGEALLRRVQVAHPDVMRVVLSGQTDRKVAARMVHVAHQFLSKPCDVDMLRRRLGDALALRAHFRQATVRALVSGLGQLQISEHVREVLGAALGNGPAPIDPLVDMVLQDSALCAKVLQIANSAFFGPPRQSSGIQTAVRALGAESLRAALAATDTSPSPSDPAQQRELQQRASAIGAVARVVALDVNVDPDQALAAGLLSTLGARMFCTYLTPEHAAARRRAREARLPIQEVELQCFGTTHAQVGAYLAGLWGLEPALVAALRNGEPPKLPERESVDLPWVLHVACALAEEACADGLQYFAPLDRAALGQHGVNHERWSNAARQALLERPGPVHTESCRKPAPVTRVE